MTEPGASTNGAVGISMMSHMIDIALDALEGLDRRLELVPASLGVLAALLLPVPMERPIQLQLAGAGSAATVVAVGLALLGLAGRSTDIGPDPAGLTARFDDPAPSFYVDVAGPRTASLEALATLTAKKTWHLNLALFAASAAMLLFLAARLVSIS